MVPPVDVADGWMQSPDPKMARRGPRSDARTLGVRRVPADGGGGRRTVPRDGAQPRRQLRGGGGTDAVPVRRLGGERSRAASSGPASASGRKRRRDGGGVGESRTQKRPRGATPTWHHPEPQEGVASETEMERRRKKPRFSPSAETNAKQVFALAPTRKDRSRNRKKLSKQAKLRLAADKVQGADTAAPFSRGSSASVRKLLTLELANDLDKDMAAFAAFVALTPEECAFRGRVFRELEALVRRVFPAASVALYGSSSSGMETFRSDLDITVGNLDGTAMLLCASIARDRDTRVDGGSEEKQQGDDDDDDEDVQREYVVSDTDGASEDEDSDAEPTFSLNLSLPGQRGSATPPLVAASAPLQSPWNPTLRRQKMRQLRALQHVVMTHRPHYQVKCLSKAKIPILMIVDAASGLHIDLGVNREAFHASDHGRTTTLVAALQRALGAPFFSLVVFLKEFLRQFDLDKPFTGGLGSYRLYMMAAYIFTTRFAASTTHPPTKVVSPGKALLTFLEVFGNRQRRGFLSSATQLPVRLGQLMDVVDFHPVFKLDECVDKFAMAFDIISKHRNLGCVVYEETLQTERRESAQRILRHVEREAQRRAARQEDDDDENAEADASESHSGEESTYEDEH